MNNTELILSRKPIIHKNTVENKPVKIIPVWGDDLGDTDGDVWPNNEDWE